ncbi:hypothetical protein NXW36_23530 [Bacteroides fragilis]|nr:hypothetical protein NXW36_23530 [Bacteroides fragilis]
MSKKELLFFLFVLAAGGVMAQQYRERGDFDRGGYRKFFWTQYICQPEFVI